MDLQRKIAVLTEHQVLRSEYRFPLAISLVFIILGMIPTVLGILNSSSEQVFIHTAGPAFESCNAYFMLARQAQNGHNLFTNRLTPELLPYALFSPEWWLYGKICRWTGLPIETVHHLDRIVTVPFLLCSIYFLCTICLENRFQRRFALMVIVFGMGLGWIPWLITRMGLANFPPSMDIRGFTTFGNLLWMPHFIRVQAVEILFIAFLILGTQTRKLRPFAASGVALLGLMFLRPYHAPVAWATCLLAIVLMSARDRRVDLALSSKYILVILISLPMALYHLYVKLSGIMGVTDLDTPQALLFGFILHFGLPFLLSLICFEGFVRVQERQISTLILSLWCLVTILVAQAYPYWRSGGEAWSPFQIAPAILATGGPLRRLYGWLTRHRLLDGFFPVRMKQEKRKLLLACLFMGLACLSNIIFFGGLVGTVNAQQYPSFISADMMNAYAWLDTNTQPDEVVLCRSWPSFVPRYSHNKVVNGSWAMTVDFVKRCQEVDRFYRRQADDAYKRDLARRYRVRYVLSSPYDDIAGGMDSGDHPWLVPVYRSGQVTVYEVRVRRSSASAPYPRNEAGM